MSGVIVIEKDLLRSSAYRGLTGTAKDVLHEFLMRRKVKTRKDSKGNKYLAILNNGEIEFTYAEAERILGITRKTFATAIDQLIERGFLKIKHSGQGGRKGDTSKYELTSDWQKYGSTEFSVKERSKDKRRGIGFAKVWEKRKAS